MPDDTILVDLPQREPATAMQPVVDPAGWTGAELAARDDWKFQLTEADVAEIDAAVAGIEARGIEIKDITVEDFPLPGLDARLAAVKDRIIEGPGLH